MKLKRFEELNEEVASIVGLPDEEEFANLPVMSTLRKEYDYCLILVQMEDGTVGLYDGEKGMELTEKYDSIEDADTKGFELDRELTEVVCHRFSGVKFVYYAHL